MKMFHFLAAAAAVGGLAAPAAAQYGYPSAGQPYGYGQPAYGYGQPYGYQQGYTQNPVEQIIGQLLGNRYNVNDRSAVSRWEWAAHWS